VCGRTRVELGVWQPRRQEQGPLKGPLSFSRVAEMNGSLKRVGGPATTAKRHGGREKKRERERERV
jgi:hypothetical protein